jgi:uncharacterized membrane protein
MEGTTTEHNSSLIPSIFNICTSWWTAVICMLRSLVLGQKYAGNDFWGAEWAVAATWTHGSKSLLAVYGQREACPPH